MPDERSMPVRSYPTHPGRVLPCKLLAVDCKVSWQACKRRDRTGQERESESALREANRFGEGLFVCSNVAEVSRPFD